MIIAEIIGGLGNQLFEYAHARALSLTLNQELYFDLSFFDRYYRDDVYRLDKFNVKIKVAEAKDIKRVQRKLIKPDILRRGLRLLGSSGYYSNSNHFVESWFQSNTINKLTNNKDIYISGYYGDEKYFSEVKSIISAELCLTEKMNVQNADCLKQIEKSESVSLHIRRGDYINNSYFAELTLDYYRRAIACIESYYPKSTYYIFSDDLDWVRENLEMYVETVFVDINDASTDYLDLMLMAACKHNIIANSTFSWWGAWLNKNPEKIIIAPRVWFKDMVAQSKYSSGSLVPVAWLKI